MIRLVLVLLLAATPAPAQGPLAVQFERALELDAEYRALVAGRDAEGARRFAVNSPIAGSPYVGSIARSDVHGPNRVREFEVGVGAPIWLPGQRSALGAEVTARVAELTAQIERRALEVAGALRDALWAAALAERESGIARQRLATARDIARDIARQAELGDISGQAALLGQNDTLAAELELSRTVAEAEAARIVYRALTGGLDPAADIEAAPRRVVTHPLLYAAEASLAAAKARDRTVAATPRDNPELGVFGRQQEGYRSERNISFGLNLRIPLATMARNAPRRAAAQADVTRATAELEQRRRLVAADVLVARRALQAAQEADRLARARLAVAERQLAGARTAFRAGETSIFDLYRVRQLQIEAVTAAGRTAVGLGRARARLNQALGVLPSELAQVSPEPGGDAAPEPARR